MINKFIQSLSIHYRHENDLSNITHITALTDDDFRTKFLKFFFPSIDISKVKEIEREKPDKTDSGSRVDFYISMEDAELYIIEVKINDRNHHFGQYDDAYGITKDHFGYITNYNCIEGKKLGYDVKTWEEFYDYMTAFSDNSDITRGYLTYLKSVCYIIKFDKTMNLEGLTTIPCFIETAKKIINSLGSDLELCEYKTYCYPTSVQQGFFFNHKDNKGSNCFGAIGLWFNDKPVITLGISNNTEIISKINQNKSMITRDAECFEEPYTEGYWKADDLWFELNENKTKQFQNAKTYEEQYHILYEFVKETLLKVLIFL